jgi:hypothetical protein
MVCMMCDQGTRSVGSNTSRLLCIAAMQSGKIPSVEVQALFCHTDPVGVQGSKRVNPTPLVYQKKTPAV